MVKCRRMGNGHWKAVTWMLLACGLGSCSADLALFRADWTWWSTGSTPGASALTRSAPLDALVGADGSCPAGAGEGTRGVGLGMTECEVVSVMGPTDRIEIAANERGERTAVLTYPQGERGGIYRFNSGLLVSIERLPEAAKPARPQRAQRSRQRT